MHYAFAAVKMANC